MPPNSMVYRATIWATTKPYSVQLLVEVESKLLYHHTISFYYFHIGNEVFMPYARARQFGRTLIEKYDFLK